jgi:hypothetical protein
MAAASAYASVVKVFLSWSGEQSRAAALALRKWLPDVIQGVKPWMSESDIEAGARWGRQVEEKLSFSRFGIICLTSSNQTAPWIMFEAGALAKTIEDSFVCPYLLDLEPSEILPGPLTQFQAKRADESGTRDLLKAMNLALKEITLAEEQLQRAFTVWWPSLRQQLANLPRDTATRSSQRPLQSMVGEILESVRELRRRDDDATAWRRKIEPYISTVLQNAEESQGELELIDGGPTPAQDAPAIPDIKDGDADEQWATDIDGGAGS